MGKTEAPKYAKKDPEPSFSLPIVHLSPELRDFVEDTRALRDVLAQAPNRPASLRRMPTPEQRAQLDRERDPGVRPHASARVTFARIWLELTAFKSHQ